MTDRYPTSPEPDESEILTGGVNEIVRIGATLRRPTGPWTPAVHALLGHLAAVGFTAAPRAYGLDERGREIVDYLPGEVADDPMPDYARSAAALVAAARLLRRYHDATATFVAPPDAIWQLPTRQPAEVLCHGDVAPYNCVFRDGLPAAFIDFDAAHPGPRRWDVAYAAYRFVPLSDPVDVGRLRAFVDAYGLADTDRALLVETVIDRLTALVDFMYASAEAGNESFQRHILEGHDRLYLGDIAHLRDRADVLTRALYAETGHNGR